MINKNNTIGAAIGLVVLRKDGRRLTESEMQRLLANLGEEIEYAGYSYIGKWQHVERNPKEASSEQAFK